MASNLCVCIHFSFLSDKKCTYGIKCKFYHPERANQSYLSLADELREKAQISTVKEERNTRSPKQPQSDTGHAHNTCSQPRDSNTGRKGSSHTGHVSENKVLYWDDPRNCLSSNHVVCSGTGGQKDWPGLPSAPGHYYAKMSHEYLDSGLGSFDSQYSDHSHCLSNSHSLRSQQQNAHPGSRHTSVHVGKNNNSHSCGCCSHSVSSTAHQHHQQNLDSMGQPNYPPQIFPPGVVHQHSLPNHIQYSGAPHYQQQYWSDPFQGLPQARTSCSLPSSTHSSHSHSSCCSYKGHEYHAWGQQQSPSSSFDPQRLDVRKKLQAIFNPHEVDTVMEMFPHLIDAEKLAAKILNLKSQRGVFWSFSSLLLTQNLCWPQLYMKCMSQQNIECLEKPITIAEWFDR